MKFSPGNYTMETPVTSSGAGNGTTGMIAEGQQILISGAGGDQQLVMSAEDAAQFFQQAGIQWDAGSGQVIIGDVQPQEGTTEGEVRSKYDKCMILYFTPIFKPLPTDY